MHRPRHNGNSAIKKRAQHHQHNNHVNQQEKQNNSRNQNRLPPQHPQRAGGGMSMAVPIPQPVDGMQLQHNSSKLPQYYYQAGQTANFNQISKTATNLLNDNKQHQYIFVQPPTAGPYFKFPPPPAPPPYPKPPVVPPYPKQNEPLPRVPLSKPSTPTQHLYETIPDKPPVPRPRELQVQSNRTQKKRVSSVHHHHNSQIQSNMSHQRKHMSMVNEQQQLQLQHHQHHLQQQQLQYQQQLQKPIVSNISSGIQYNNEQRTSADGGVAQPHYSYGKQQQHQHQQQQHHQQQHQQHRNHNEKGLQQPPSFVEKDVREMPVGSAGEMYDTRYIEEKIKESLLDNNNSRLPILYEEADGGAQHHHQNDGRIMVTKYAYRNSQIDLMAETAQAVAAASYYASR